MHTKQKEKVLENEREIACDDVYKFKSHTVSKHSRSRSININTNVTLLVLHSPLLTVYISHYYLNTVVTRLHLLEQKQYKLHTLFLVFTHTLFPNTVTVHCKLCNTNI